MMGDVQSIPVQPQAYSNEMIQAFRAHFITCTQVPQPIDALLSMKMGSGETLWSYTNRYWELYNEMGGGNKQVTTSTFKLGAPLGIRTKRFVDHATP